LEAYITCGRGTPGAWLICLCSTTFKAFLRLRVKSSRLSKQQMEDAQALTNKMTASVWCSFRRASCSNVGSTLESKDTAQVTAFQEQVAVISLPLIETFRTGLCKSCYHTDTDTTQTRHDRYLAIFCILQCLVQLPAVITVFRDICEEWCG